jgi:hypothetical protein
MAAVGVVVIEDRFEGFGCFPDEPVVADVDPLVDVGGEDLAPILTKGRSTCSE